MPEQKDALEKNMKIGEEKSTRSMIYYYRDQNVILYAFSKSGVRSQKLLQFPAFRL